MRVGPFLPNEKISKADVETMDRYMLRTWVEICLYRAKLDEVRFAGEHAKISYTAELIRRQTDEQ